MTKSLVFIVSLFISLTVYGQNSTDSIKKVDMGLSHFYTQNGQVLTYAKMTTLMEENAEATKYLNKAKTLNTLAMIPGFVGGFCIGYPIGRSLSGQKTNWTPFVIGCGLLAIYIPLVISTNKNVKKAVDAYNKEKTISYSPRNRFDIRAGFTQNGLGLTLGF